MSALEKLRPRQREFVRAYVGRAGRDARRAFAMAGYKAAHAEANAYRLLAQPKIKAALAELEAEAPAPRVDRPALHDANRDASGRWRRGASGNPSGRAPGRRLTDALREVLGEPIEDGSSARLDRIAQRLVRMVEDELDPERGRPDPQVLNATLRAVFDRVDPAPKAPAVAVTIGEVSMIPYAQLIGADAQAIANLSNDRDRLPRPSRDPDARRELTDEEVEASMVEVWANDRAEDGRAVERESGGDHNAPPSRSANAAEKRIAPESASPVN
jgi:hypothetical protein